MGSIKWEDCKGNHFIGAITTEAGYRTTYQRRCDSCHNMLECNRQHMNSGQTFVCNDVPHLGLNFWNVRLNVPYICSPCVPPLSNNELKIISDML